MLSYGFSVYRSPAFAADRHTTDDVGLMNRYYYRLVQRADLIAPGKQFTPSFKPLSIRESNSLFLDNDTLASIKTRAENYYRTEAREEKIERFSLHPLTELHVTAIHSEEKDAPLYAQYGAELEGNTYASAVAAGKAYVGDMACLSYDLRLSNDGDVDTIDLFRYKLKSGWKHMAVSLTKDNIVIGPGYFGNLLQSNNVQPENSVILKTEVPYDWGALGAFRWYAWHTWFDDDERENKDPRLLGARVSLMPWDVMEIGFTRTALYGGSENASYDSPNAYWEMFTGANENEPDNPYNSQQQASFDLSVYFPFIKGYTPFSGGKIYMEYAFTDIKAFWQSEDRDSGVLFEPLGVSRLAGLMLTTGKTDIVLEYVQTSRVAYTGGGGGFSAGYTDNGYVIGHFANGNSSGTLCEIYHELSPSFHVNAGLGYLSHRSYTEKDYQTEKDIFAGGTWFLTDSISIKLTGTYQYFDKTDTDPSPITSSFSDKSYSNTIIHFSMDFHF